MPSSGYTANSFTAGQQPTTTIWNELWANDASFNSGAGFNDGIIITRHIAAGIQLRQLESLPYKFNVYRNAAQNIGNGTPTIINYDTKTGNGAFDTGANVDVVTNKGRFTAPVAGFYYFNAQGLIASAGTANAYIELILYKNGVAALYGNNSRAPIAGSIIASMVSGLVQLSANDYIEIFAIGNGDALYVAEPGKSAYFQGFLVSAT
jgi:hypothetical protein